MSLHSASLGLRSFSSALLWPSPTPHGQLAFLIGLQFEGLYWQWQLAVAFFCLPVHSNELKSVRFLFFFNCIKIHPIPVCLSHVVSCSLSLLIWRHKTKMNAVVLPLSPAETCHYLQCVWNEQRTTLSWLRVVTNVMWLWESPSRGPWSFLVFSVFCV